MHLDDATWKRLWTDPSSAAPMLEHLKAGCEVCDAFIASRPELDGEVDQLLLSLSPREAALDEMGWRRLRARLGKERRSLAAVIALAAGLTVVVGASFAVRSVVGSAAPFDGVKGGPGRARMEVVAARQLPTGAFEQVPPAGRVPRGSTLAFRVTSPVDGPARVLLQRGAELPEELAQLRVRHGANQLEQESGLFGVNLEDEQGLVSVWVVAHDVPFDVDEALEAITSSTSPLAVGRVEVFVEP